MDCLKSYSDPETLSGDNKWYCPVCKQQRTATKIIEFWKLPFVLVLHLKRFVAESARGDRWNKVCAKVKSKLSLDLSELEINNSKTSCLYEVACTANHVGNDIESGHYTATCRHPVNGVGGPGVSYGKMGSMSVVLL